MEIRVYITGKAWCVAFDWAASPAATCPAVAAAGGPAGLSSSAEAEKNHDGHCVHAHSDC